MSPEEDATAPHPQGSYRSAVVWGDQVITAGVTPRRNGVLVETGVVGAEIGVDRARELVALATGSAIIAARSALAEVGPEHRLVRCIRAHLLLRTTPDFVDHAHVADAMSAILTAELGAEGVGARTASGAASLPGGAPCEVELTFAHEFESDECPASAEAAAGKVATTGSVWNGLRGESATPRGWTHGAVT